jgi:hypothetical protein
MKGAARDEILLSRGIPGPNLQAIDHRPLAWKSQIALLSRYGQGIHLLYL